MKGLLSAFIVGQSTRLPPVTLPGASVDNPMRSGSAVTFIVGSSTACDFPIQDGGLEPEHLGFTWDARLSSWIVQNLALTPLRVDGEPVGQGETLPLLVWAAALRTKGVEIRFERQPDAPTQGGTGAASAVVPLTAAGLIIGRGPENKDKSNTPRLALDPAMRSVGKNQAEIQKRGAEFILINHNTDPGGRTILNGDQNFDERKLVLGDCIQIPNCQYYTFKFLGTSLKHLGQGGSLQGHDLTVDVDAGRILHPVDLELKKGEFLGIIGGSGQGKSTLMNSVCGIVPATSGSVYVDRRRLESPRDVARAGIAFVPQDDIVHKELTVEDALYYAGRLRLNGTPKQIRDLVDATIATVDLSPHRKKRIGFLSGGQRKRVSIASELLVGPDYLFLDEPTSGLDPLTEESVMEELRLLGARKGIGVACTTHMLANCQLLTHIAFISRGRLIFHGRPVDAGRFFMASGSPEEAERLRLAEAAANEEGGDGESSDEASQFTDDFVLANMAKIYRIAQDTSTPVSQQDAVAESWQREYKASRFHEPVNKDDVAGAPVPLPNPQRVSSMRCLLLLISRQWKILASSPLNYLFLGAQALIIGLLIAWVSENLVLQMFLALIATLWFGCSNGAQQIVAELAIYRRERLAGLGINTYLLSKFLFYTAITGLQGLILFAILICGTPFLHPNTEPDLEKAKADFTGRVPDKQTREFRKAFFEKDQWDALAVGDDSHPGEETTPSLGAKSSTPTVPDDFTVVGDDAPKPAASGPPIPQASTVYVNPTGLHPKDGDYLLLEKVAKVLRMRENVLGRLAVHKVTLKPGDSAKLAQLESAASWKIFIFSLILLRLGALLGAALVGVALGLAISSLVDTPTQSVMWVPLILIPQILFGSFVVVVPEMNDSVLFFSRCLPSFNLQQVMDVGLIYGSTTPKMTNQTKIPAFIEPPPKDTEEVEWQYPKLAAGGPPLGDALDHEDIENPAGQPSTSSEASRTTPYERVNQVNKSWQNLIVRRDLLGAREKRIKPNGDAEEQVDRRRDILPYRHESEDDSRANRHQRYIDRNGQEQDYQVAFSDLGPARVSGGVLGGWVLACYGVAVISLYRRQTGR